jgi:CubicO group peptidase (beta-lactamase class C family)
MNKTIQCFFVVLLLSLSVLSVVNGDSASTYWPDNQWRSSTPEEQGIDSEGIYHMLSYVKDQKLDLHSVLMIRNGYLVTEVYFGPYQRDIRQGVFSCTKSVVSALCGIAMQEGYIKGLDDQVFDYFKGEAIKNIDDQKRSITLKHLLTMSSGLEVAFTGPMLSSGKPIDFVLEKPLVDNPGEVFKYNPGAVHLLSAIIKETAGSDTLYYAKIKLFDPLGISNVSWQADSNGVNVGGTGLSLAPFEMAKLGYLYLRNGVWNGKQIVPEEWVKASAQKYIETPLMNEAENSGYGYLWWINSFGGYSAHGFGGQYIYVIPEKDLVVVFTSGLNDSVFPLPKKLMEDYILPAVKSEKPLPKNNKIKTSMNNLVKDLRDSNRLPVPPLSGAAKKILGKTFVCEKNSMGYYSFSLNLNKGNEGLIKLAYVNDPAGIIEIPVGLDNVYRRSGEQTQTVFAKGRWLDENTFELISHQVPAKVICTLKFSNNTAKVVVNNELSGLKEEFEAKMND